MKRGDLMCNKLNLQLLGISESVTVYLVIDKDLDKEYIDIQYISGGATGRILPVRKDSLYEFPDPERYFRPVQKRIREED